MKGFYILAGGKKKESIRKGTRVRWVMSEIISNLYYHSAAIGSAIAASLLLTRDKPPQICVLGWAPSPALRQHRPSKASIDCVLHLNCQSVLLIKWISGFRVGGEGGGGVGGRRGGRWGRRGVKGKQPFTAWTEQDERNRHKSDSTVWAH